MRTDDLKSFQEKNINNNNELYLYIFGGRCKQETYNDLKKQVHKFPILKVNMLTIVAMGGGVRAMMTV